MFQHPARIGESVHFGCVRSDGYPIEGIDIKCVQRDKMGHPVDPIYATADGVVVCKQQAIFIKLRKIYCYPSCD